MCNQKFQSYGNSSLKSVIEFFQYLFNLFSIFFLNSAFPEYLDCEVIVIPAKYDFKPYAYGFQKDSPYLGLFNHFLKEMREKGSLKQILNKYESGAQVCPDESGKSLGFESVFTAFLALLSGLVLGFILLILEYFPNWGNYLLLFFPESIPE